jgi:hypothetical protein
MKRRRNSIIMCTCLVLSVLLLTTTAAQATENGVTSGAIGAEDFFGGALPPPGFYYLNYLTYYSAGTLRDNNGDKVPGKFSIDALADINRFVYITKYKILGADYGFQVIVPLVDLGLTVTTPGGPMSQSRAGIADLVVTPLILGWHFSKNWHAVFGLDAFLPTGPYNKTRLANVGRNYWSTEIAAAFTYMSDNGIEFSNKFMYDINFNNSDTDYKSGNEFHVDSLLGIHLGKWKLGLNAYYYKQVTDDKVGDKYAGPPLTDGNRGQVLGIGPAIGYEYNHIHFAFKYQKEMQAKNKFEGDRFWFKVAIPF